MPNLPARQEGPKLHAEPGAAPGLEARPAQSTRVPQFLAGVPSQQAVTPHRFASRAEATSPLPPIDRPAPPRTVRADLRQAPAPVSANVQALHGVRDPETELPPPSPISDSLLQRERERLVHAVETLRLQSDRLAELARADTLEIAFQIARRIVEAELKTGPEALFSLVRSALKQVGEARRVKVRVNPTDGELLRSPQGVAASLGPSIARIEIIDDASLQRGDCLVDTDFGHVDGRLSTRLGELKRVLSVAEDAA